MNCPYLDDNNSIKRLVREWNTYNGIIIGFDFDNTVFDYHNLGYDYSEIINLLKKCKKNNCTMVLYTSLDNTKIKNALKYLKDNELMPDYINTTPDFINFAKSNNCKPYCNIYIDDRAGLSSAFNILSTTLNIINNKKEML